MEASGAALAAQAQLALPSGAVVVGYDSLYRWAAAGMMSVHPLDLHLQASTASCLVAEAVDRFGAIDVLFNNGAMAYFAWIGEMNDDTWYKTTHRGIESGVPADAGGGGRNSVKSKGAECEHRVDFRLDGVGSCCRVSLAWLPAVSSTWASRDGRAAAWNPPTPVSRCTTKPIRCDLHIEDPLRVHKTTGCAMMNRMASAWRKWQRAVGVPGQGGDALRRHRWHRHPRDGGVLAQEAQQHALFRKSAIARHIDKALTSTLHQSFAAETASVKVIDDKSRVF